MKSILRVSFFLLCVSSATPAFSQYDIIIRNGNVHNGLGAKPVVTDIGINKDTIAFIGDLNKSKGLKEINAKNLEVTPGFINMLSWSETHLTKDGRQMSDIKQGVTLEVLGEGLSAGPRKPRAKDKRWLTLGQFFTYIEKIGVSTNVASFVGATTVRLYVLIHPTYEAGWRSGSRN